MGLLICYIYIYADDDFFWIHICNVCWTSVITIIIIIIIIMLLSKRLDVNSFKDTKTDEYLKYYYCIIQVSQKTKNINISSGHSFFRHSLSKKATQKSSSSLFIQQLFAVKEGGVINFIGSFALMSFYINLKNFQRF